MTQTIQSIKDILAKKSFKPDTHNKYEFQAYGNRLAEEFGDTKRRALYIKLAKTTDRNLLDAAREFVMRSENAETKGKLFMWKLTQLKQARLDKSTQQENPKNPE